MSKPPPAKCGTDAGYQRHRRHGEPPCDACKAGRRAADRERRRRRRERAPAPVPAARPLAPCGTEAAHSRHKAHGETPCDACKQAHRAYKREWHARRRAETWEARPDYGECLTCADLEHLLWSMREPVEQVCARLGMNPRSAQNHARKHNLPHVAALIAPYCYNPERIAA